MTTPPDDPYTAIRVATLRGDLKIAFDVFVRVAGKHILYCRRGDSFEGKRLERLKAKKLKKMFIRPEDDVLYRQYLEESIDTAYKPGKSLDIRGEVIQGFQQAAAEQYMEEPKDEFAYNHVRSSVQRFTEFLEKEPLGARVILQLQNTDLSISHHGVAVAALAVAMTLDNGLREGQPLHLLALGCLLHDIEHYFSGINLEWPIAGFSDEELAHYKAHPVEGAGRLLAANFVDPLVLKVISQHEETVDGTGFPAGLLERDMDPLVVIASTANSYDRLVCFENSPPKEALKTMLVRKMGNHPLAHMQTLQNILKRQAIL